MPTNFDARSFVSDFVSSMNAKDPERLLNLYADNVEIKDPTLPQAVRGKDAVRKNFEQWSSAFSELEMNVKDVIQSGNKVALFIEGKARHTGEMGIAPGEKVPATNKTVRMEIGEFLTLDASGKVSKDYTIFDMAGMMMQLGLLPAAQTSATKAPAGQQVGSRGR